MARVIRQKDKCPCLEDSYSGYEIQGNEIEDPESLFFSVTYLCCGFTRSSSGFTWFPTKAGRNNVNNINFQN